MANYCETSYRIRGNKEQLEELRKVFKKCYIGEDGKMRSGWLDTATFIHELIGGDTEDYNDYHGQVLWVDVESENDLSIDVDTKWNRHDSIEEVIQDRFPDLEVYFESEEFGCGIYETNDCNGVYFNPDAVYVSFDCEGEYFSNRQEALDYINEELGVEAFKSLEEADEAGSYYFEEDDEEVTFSVYMIDVLS